MIGCSFVVDREYFGDIGLLDPGMEVYGAENIELGMRVSEAAWAARVPGCQPWEDGDSACAHGSRGGRRGSGSQAVGRAEPWL